MEITKATTAIKRQDLHLFILILKICQIERKKLNENAVLIYT